jgi:two-component system sensor histidine kinase UhpB
MNDQDPAREPSVEEVAQLRRRVAEESALPGLRTAAAIFQVAPLGIHQCDTEGRITFVNPSQEAITGFTADELVGTYIWERLAPGPEKESLPAYFQRLVAEQPAPAPFFAKNVKKSGELFDARVDWNYIRNPQGDVTGFVSIVTDITERKQTEQALLESERRLSTLMSNLPGMAYRCRNDSQWRMEFVSDGCSELTGYPAPELLENRGVAYGDIIHPDDRQAVWDQIQRALAERRRFQLEYRIRTAQGEERWVWEQGVGIFSGAEDLQALEGFISDITDRKRAERQLQEANDRLEQRVGERTAELTTANQHLNAEVAQRRQAEEAIRQSEAKYRALVKSCPDAVTLLDLQGRVVFASQRAVEQHGMLAPGELVGRPITDFVVESERERLRMSLGRLNEEGVHRNIEYTARRQDGTTFETEVSSAIIRDAAGNPEAVIGVSRDITERKLAEEALRQSYVALEASKERYELAVRGAGVGIWDWDIRTGRLLFTPRWKALFGYDESEIGEVLEDWVRLVHPDDREGVAKYLGDFLAGTSSIITGEYRLRHKDGSYRWIMSHAVVVRDEQGKAVRMVGSHGDITDRKQAEEEREREHEALRRMVLASDHERRLITYELHDGVAQQLLGAKMLFESQQPSKGRKSQAAEAYSDGMEALTQATAELRRVMNRLRTPVLDRFGLVEAIKDVASQLQSTAGAPAIECHSDVRFDRLESTLENSLYRIAQESMTNACRYSQSEKVRVTLTQEGDEVTLEVRDWGVGFDQAAVQENRFGLEGIRERSRLLGGKLSVESEPGQGTVVRVTLPVIEAVDPE